MSETFGMYVLVGPNTATMTTLPKNATNTKLFNFEPEIVDFWEHDRSQCKFMQLQVGNPSKRTAVKLRSNTIDGPFDYLEIACHSRLA
jgi:hypothetical protein